MRENGLYSRAAILKSRYGTESGSDLVASEAVARGGTRSLPLPVPYRAMIAERLSDLSDQKQRPANNNQSISRRDPQGFGQSSAGIFNADHITMGRFRDRGRLGGARAGDSGNYDLIRGGEENLAHLSDRFVGHHSKEDRDRSRAEMLIEEIAQRPRAGRVVRPVQEQRRLRRRRPDHLQSPGPFGVVQSFDNRRLRNVEAGDPQSLGDVDCDHCIRDLMPPPQSQSQGVFI